jgi:8-oxo-dGTP diphosphatase
VDRPSSRDGRYRCAAIFFVSASGELLLRLRDDRPDILEPNRWDVIGGLIEAGETPDQAALREAAEEVGLRPDEIAFWAVHEGRITTFFLYYARLDRPAGSLLLTEGQEVRFVSPEALADLQLVPWLRDALPRFLASPAYADCFQEPTPA